MPLSRYVVVSTLRIAYIVAYFAKAVSYTTKMLFTLAPRPILPPNGQFSIIQLKPESRSVKSFMTAEQKYFQLRNGLAWDIQPQSYLHWDIPQSARRQR